MNYWENYFLFIEGRDARTRTPDRYEIFYCCCSVDVNHSGLQIGRNFYFLLMGVFIGRGDGGRLLLLSSGTAEESGRNTHFQIWRVIMAFV